MARSKHPVEAEFRLRVLQRYGLLVTFDGPAPEKLPLVASDSKTETFKSWKARVFNDSAKTVRVCLMREPGPGERLHKLLEKGPRAELKGILVQHSRAAVDVRVLKAQKVEQKAKSLKAAADRRAEMVDAAAADQVRREQSSGLDRLSSDFESWLNRAKDLDPLVEKKARRLLQQIADGEPVNHVIVDLVLFASECRKLVARSTPNAPQS